MFCQSSSGVGLDGKGSLGMDNILFHKTKSRNIGNKKWEAYYARETKRPWLEKPKGYLQEENSRDRAWGAKSRGKSYGSWTLIRFYPSAWDLSNFLFALIWWDKI